MDITISKISYFSFSFKLNVKESANTKNVVWRGKRGCEKVICDGPLVRALEISQKLGRGVTRKGWGKI